MPMVVNMHELAMGNCKKIVKKEQTIIIIAGKETKLSYLISKKRKEEKSDRHQQNRMKKKDKTAAQLQLVCQIQILLREKLLDPDSHSLRAHDYQSTTWDFHIILA